MKFSGIYKITCKANGKVYIGSSKNINVRFQIHRHRLRRNLHVNPLLQNVWNKHGEDSFLFEVIESCEEKDLLKREQYWMDFYDSYNVRKKGLNVITEAERHSLPQSVRDKISKALKGVPKSEKARQNMKMAQQNRTQEWCDGISSGKIGKQFSNEHKNKISRARMGQKIGKKRVICTNTGEVFDSCRDVEIKYGIKQATLSVAIKRGVEIKGNLFKLTGEQQVGRRCKCVTTGEEFETITAAAEKHGIRPTTLMAALRQKTRSGGKEFQYLN